MARNLIPKREEPKKEISTPVKVSTRDPLSDRRKQGNVASMEAAKKSAASGEARKRHYAEAVKWLGDAHPSSAVERMRTLPLAMLEMYILAEQENLARPEVLMYFPKPGARARTQWLGEVPPQPKQKPKAKSKPKAQREES